MLDDPSPYSQTPPPPPPHPVFRAGVSRMDRIRQRFWATRVRLSLGLRRDKGEAAQRKRSR